MKKVTKTTVEIIIDPKDIEDAARLTLILPENNSGINKLEFDLENKGLKVNNHIIRIQKKCEESDKPEEKATNPKEGGDAKKTKKERKIKKLKPYQRKFKNGVYTQLSRDFASKQISDWIKRQFIAHTAWKKWENGLIDFFDQNAKLDLGKNYTVWSVGLWLAKDSNSLRIACGGQKTFDMLQWLFEPIMVQLKDIAGVKK